MMVLHSWGFRSYPTFVPNGPGERKCSPNQPNDAPFSSASFPRKPKKEKKRLADKLHFWVGRNKLLSGKRNFFFLSEKKVGTGKPQKREIGRKGNWFFLRHFFEGIRRLSIRNRGSSSPTHFFLPSTTHVVAVKSLLNIPRIMLNFKTEREGGVGLAYHPGRSTFPTFKTSPCSMFILGSTEQGMMAGYKQWEIFFLSLSSPHLLNGRPGHLWGVYLN